MGVGCLTVRFVLDNLRGGSCFGGIVGIFGARWNVVFTQYSTTWNSRLISIKDLIGCVQYIL